MKALIGALATTCSLLAAGLSAAGAQEPARDPTAPPLALLQPADTSAGLAAGLPDLQGANVVKRNGQPHLVIDGRLLAVGQRLGDWRIDRITETDVWLRRGRERERVPRLDPSVRLRPTATPGRPTATP